MANITSDQVATLYDATVVSENDGKLGKVGTVYLDDDTQQPSWVTVKTGLFGSSETFVPLDAASLSGDEIHVPYSKDKVKDAPRMDTDAELSPQEEEELYRYYGLAGGTRDHDDVTSAKTEAGVPRTEGVGTTTDADAAEREAHGDDRRGDDRRGDDRGTRTEGHDTSGPNTDDAMTLSEERVDVGTERRETGRARLRKHVVSEKVSKDVPVSHEEVVVEREPITDENRGAATSGAELSEEEHEVTLHEERPVVEKETVATERVKLGTETVTDTERVSAEARREEVEVDDAGTTSRRDDDTTSRDRDADRR